MPKSKVQLNKTPEMKLEFVGRIGQDLPIKSHYILLGLEILKK